jgi:hypothetical protein
VDADADVERSRMERRRRERAFIEALLKRTRSLARRSTGRVRVRARGSHILYASWTRGIASAGMNPTSLTPAQNTGLVLLRTLMEWCLATRWIPRDTAGRCPSG